MLRRTNSVLRFQKPTVNDESFLPSKSRPESIPQSYVPIFQEDWEQEYKATSYYPYPARAVCCIGTVYFLLDFLYSAFIDSGDGTGGNFTWSFLTQFPRLACSFMYCITAVLLSMGIFRRFCIRNFNSICGLKIVLTYLGLVSPRVMIEVRRALFQRSKYPHIHWGLDYSSHLPYRTCNDTDPVKTWTMMNSIEDDMTSVGCENTVLAGGMLSSYIFLNLISVLYHMSPKSAIVVSLVNGIIIAAAALFTGTRDFLLISFVGFQMVAGISAAFFCHKREIISREQFAIAKGTDFASEKNSNLLFTLMPKNVVMRLGIHKSKRMLGESIKHCTVMFCSLEPQQGETIVWTADVFHLFDSIFCEFDQAVKRANMFKYQHVSDWYIVACPRAACPFDDDEQSTLYPTEYSMRMILLAHELSQIAKQYQYRDAPFRLKVGINCGPVAGAVIGSLRAFYCLYGDTINTAARMCKYAENEIRCSDNFYEQMKGKYPSLIRIFRRGSKEIKGKGKMNLYDISINQEQNNFALRAKQSASIDSEIMRRKSLAAPRRKRGCLSATFALFLDLKIKKLGQEAWVWTKEPTRRIDYWWTRFQNESFEKLFIDAQARSTRQSLIAGVALHVCTVICLWHAAVYPEYRYNFQALGSSSLDSAMRSVWWILTMYLCLGTLYCALLIVAMWRYPQFAVVAEKHYVLIKMIHMGISIAVFRELPALWGLFMSFTMEMICLHVATASISYRFALGIVSTSYLAFAISLSVVRGTVTYAVVKAFAFAVGAVWLSRIGNYNQRVRWRLEKLFESEMLRLREMLFDLLPSRIAQNMIDIPEKIPCEVGEAAILQLDICGFTVMSQTLSPMELAETIHQLFSIFDESVRACGLFKMDTVGDAYLVAALLPADPCSECGEESSHRRGVHEVLAARSAEMERGRGCEIMLELARKMLETMENFRQQSGLDLQCRIGVSVGPVLMGVLGELQPRFHIFGPAMKSVDALEQGGLPGNVHVGASFVRVLQRAGQDLKTWILESQKTGVLNRLASTSSSIVLATSPDSPRRKMLSSNSFATVADQNRGWSVGEAELVYAKTSPTTTALHDGKDTVTVCEGVVIEGAPSNNDDLNSSENEIGNDFWYLRGWIPIKERYHIGCTCSQSSSTPCKLDETNEAVLGTITASKDEEKAKEVRLDAGGELAEAESTSDDGDVLWESTLSEAWTPDQMEAMNSSALKSQVPRFLPAGSLGKSFSECLTSAGDRLRNRGESNLERHGVGEAMTLRSKVSELRALMADDSLLAVPPFEASGGFLMDASALGAGEQAKQSSSDLAIRSQVGTSKTAPGLDLMLEPAFGSGVGNGEESTIERSKSFCDVLIGAVPVKGTLILQEKAVGDSGEESKTSFPAVQCLCRSYILQPAARSSVTATTGK